MNNKQRISYFRTTHTIRTMTTKHQQKTHDNGLYQIPTNIKNFSPKHEDFKREIVTQQSKAQKDFNNKIEKEQIKITEEINELKETFAREIKKTCSELKSYYDNKEEPIIEKP